MKRIAALLILIVLALAGLVLSWAIALCMWIGGGDLARQRVMNAVVKADEMLNALVGNDQYRWLSQGAANKTGPGWRILAILLDAGAPGHLDQFRK